MPGKETDNREKPQAGKRSGQGRVKDPQRDGRLKENRERGIAKGKSR
jgi:hypothetical protein